MNEGEQFQPLPFTTLQLMKKSVLFKVLFAAGVIFVVITITFILLSAFMNCYSSCSQNTYKIYECKSTQGTVYCCQLGYPTCGYYSYCDMKQKTPCWTIFYICWISSVILFVLVLTVGIMFYNFWRRARDPNFNPGINNTQKTYTRPFLPTQNEPTYTYN